MSTVSFSLLMAGCFSQLHARGGRLGLESGVDFDGLVEVPERAAPVCLRALQQLDFFAIDAGDFASR